MRRRKAILCLVLVLLMVLSLTPSPVRAAGQVYFLAVNEQIFPLEDETMPFWSGGVLYVPYTAFYDNDLGITYARLRDKTGVLLSRQRYGALICDFSANTVYDNSSKQVLGSGAVTRGDIVFLPVDVVCRFFDLSYSYTRVTYGYLIRIKGETAQLQDSQFIDAAGIAMANRYARYERAHAAPPVPEQTPAPAAPATQPPATPATPPAGEGSDTPPQSEPEEERTVYLALEITSAESGESVLEQLGSVRAAFLFSPQGLEGTDDLLRRLVAGGCPVALRVDASGGEAAAAQQLEEANRRLWSAANSKTRLVCLDGASEETFRAVTAAGYCVLRFDADYGGTGEARLKSAGRMSAGILAAADRAGGSCRVLLGTDKAVLSAGMLPDLLSALQSGNCAFARLNEVTARQ